MNIFCLLMIHLFIEIHPYRDEEAERGGGRERERSYSLWITSQMAAMARVEPDQNQD